MICEVMDSELDRLGERIAEQAANLDAATYQLLVNLHEFDERGGWHAQGARTCAHWLSWRVGWTLPTARDRVRVARKLPQACTISDALRRGEVSYSKVRAMLRVATPANEALLLDYARLMTGSQLERTCRKYALVLRHGQDPHPLGDLQRRYVRRRDTEDGMVKIEAVLHPEEAELVWTMLNHAAKQLIRTPAPTVPDDSEQARQPEPTGRQAPADTGASLHVEPTSAGVSAETHAGCRAPTSTPSGGMSPPLESTSVEVSAETPATSTPSGGMSPQVESTSADVSAETDVRYRGRATCTLSAGMSPQYESTSAPATSDATSSQRDTRPADVSAETHGG